jgi:hypothetical protein
MRYAHSTGYSPDSPETASRRTRRTLRRNSGGHPSACLLLTEINDKQPTKRAPPNPENTTLQLG